MSLICETIVSEDELSRDKSHSQPEDELDFEEEDKEEDKEEKEDQNNNNNNDDKDEGELDDDEDLEEGEVKEDDDEEDDTQPKQQQQSQTREATQQNRQNSICRFYGRGQCTWGNNCRFVHPTGGQMPLKRLVPPPPPPPMVAPMGGRRGARGGQGGGGGPEWQQNSDNNESAWERGLKQAKEMIVRASRRKEEEIDFEDKRFNLSTIDDQSINQRQQQSMSTDDRSYADEEYERRRRLAFESAPWNNEEPPLARIRQAETYRDPWRRSKSPPQLTTKGKRPPMAGSRSGSKRSHSMSSISASASDSSDFSGSEGSDSFSESSLSNTSGRSGGGRRLNRKTASEKISSESQRFPKKETKENYDSWSESLSDSDSISSYYSDESQNQKQKQRQQTQQQHRVRKEQPPNKKIKVSAPSIKKEAPTQQQQQEAPPPPAKKSPIKMTFMKKQNMKKEFSFAKNGENLREEFEKESEEDEDEEEEEDNQQEGSGGGLQATFSRREELLQQLKAVEDAIARKRQKIN